jgi:uncharacterized membrane protein YfcA
MSWEDWRRGWEADRTDGWAMIRLPQAIAAVMACTLTAGFAGGVVGATVGRISPSFVIWLMSQGLHNAPANFDPTEFGFGLGIVSGLLLGVGSGLFLVAVLALRDAWLARAGIKVAASRLEPALG